jgi:subtilisin family serine protease
LGGQIIQSYPATPDGSLVSAILALPFENVVSVAQLNSVLWMNRSSPRPGFDDEVSDQIVVGNHAAGVPFTGYNAWLAGNGLDGTGVTVAVVDTGMDTNNNATAHLDIRGRIAAFVPYAGAPATDTDGHGTHVGGAVAGNATIGTTDPNGFLYGEGIAPNAQLVVQNALLGVAWPPAGGWQQLSQDWSTTARGFEQQLVHGAGRKAILPRPDPRHHGRETPISPRLGQRSH